MTPLPLDPIEDADFRATGQFENERLQLRMWGNADLRAKAHLDTFLDAADRRSVAAGVKEIVVDFRELVFMNSSCLKALVTWLGRAQERGPDERYTVRFLKEPAAHWQMRSFQALAAFAGEILTVE